MKKRILPVLLALCMVMSLLPVMAFAADPTVEQISCSAVPATKPADVKETVDGVEVTTTVVLPQAANPHGEVRCAASGCKCATKTTAITETPAVEADPDTDTEAQPAKKTITITYAYVAMCDACKANATCNPCDGTDGCTAKLHKADCKKVCTVEGCLLTKEHAEKHQGTKCTGDDKCPASVHNAECVSKCDVEGCTLTAEHTQKHNTTETCSEDALCSASTHTAECEKCCGNTENVSAGTGVDGCTKTLGHSDKHSGTTCTGDSRCPVASKDHTAPKYDEIGLETLDTAGCDKFVACPICTGAANGDKFSPKAKGHDGDHNNTTMCLGYNDDGKCGATEHIAGCSKYCTCDDHVDCTGEAGCPACAELGDCECPVCKASPNPGLGVVTDENGNAVDPTDPTEPTDPDVPTKAEDFTDMEDWMAADVQVALDKGWLEGYGDGTFNGRGVTSGATIAAVLARMDGETITGITWAQDALKWAEEQDAFEGIELTGDSMARKDLVLVIWRMAGKPAAEKELDFTDVDGLEGDHLTAMQWAVENGIVKGNGDGTVTPDGSVNRAALCAMLARYDALEK